MKNRILASVLCVALAAGMIACGSSKDTENTENTESTESAATVTTGITSTDGGCLRNFIFSFAAALPANKAPLLRPNDRNTVDVLHA